MGGQVWFGTENRMTWVPAPMPGVSRSLRKWRTGGQYLNGGRWARSSATGSRQVNLTWPVMTHAEVRKITAYLEGTYGTGLLFYSDPFADANVLPQWLAVPWLACDDAPRLYETVAPTQVTTPANTYDYPTFGAEYQVLGPGPQFKFPVPPNTTAHIGFHGTTTGTAVVQANGATLTPLGVTTSTLTNHTYTAPAEGGWVTLNVSGNGTLTAYGLHMSFGTAPVGPFVKGEGFSGLALAGDPDITGYTSTSTLERQSVSATFDEVGAWA